MSKETLKAFSERAIEGALTRTFIPPIVYIPASLRKRGSRLNLADHVTLNPASEAENDQRIAKADPVGFLIAMMQGQPVPAFELSKAPNGTSIIKLDWRVADLMLRSEIAMELIRLRRRARDAGKSTDDYDAMIAKAAEGDDAQTPG